MLQLKGSAPGPPERGCSSSVSRVVGLGGLPDRSRPTSETLYMVTCVNGASRGNGEDSSQFHLTDRDWDYILDSRNGEPPYKAATKKSTAEGGDLVPVAFLELEKLYPKLREPVVDGIARRGETVNVVAASKVGKSWLSYGLALSVANGVPWLGKYPCTRGKVLLVDNELHNETIVFRVRKVANALGLSPANIHILSLRGRFTDYEGLEKRLARTLETGNYSLIVIDAHYRMLPQGGDENSNGTIKDVYNLIDAMADSTRAAWFLNHHASKGDQSTKEITDVGAGAGAQSRAADGHLVIRPHKESDCYGMEAAVRSFAPLTAVGLRWEFPTWSLDDSLDPAELKTPTEARKGKSLAKNRKKVLEALRAATKPLTTNQLARAAGLTRDACEKALKKPVAFGEVEAVDWMASGNKTTAYRIPR